MESGFNISNLPDNVKAFVNAQNIDTNGDGKISRAEISQALANVNGTNETSGDAFVSNRAGVPPIPYDPTFVTNIVNLLNQINDIHEVCRLGILAQQ